VERTAATSAPDDESKAYAVRVLYGVLLLCAVLCAAGMAAVDWRLQRYRSPTALRTRFRVFPLDLFDEEHYTAEGRQHRKTAVRLLWLALAFFGAATVVLLLNS
jgi:hypothetical protein